MDAEHTMLLVFLIQQPVHFVVAFMLPQLKCIVFYDSLLSLSVPAKSDWEFLVCYFFSMNCSSHFFQHQGLSSFWNAVRRSHGKPETVFEWSACGGQQKANDGNAIFKIQLSMTLVQQARVEYLRS
jgi:hypothetical protein